MARTGVDALAIAIGTSHGAYKFTRKPTGDILAIERIARIHAAVPDTHLVMHGSSSVPQEWLAIIRKHGGDIKETYGVPVEEIQRGIAQRRAQDQHRHRHPAGDDRRDAQGLRRAAERVRPAQGADRGAQGGARASARQRFEAFGCAGQASRIKPVPLDDMVRRYR